MSIVAALDKVLFFNASSKYSVLRMKTEDSSVPAEARSPYNKAAYEGDKDLKYKCNLDNRRLPLGRICTNVR